MTRLARRAEVPDQASVAQQPAAREELRVRVRSEMSWIVTTVGLPGHGGSSVGGVEDVAARTQRPTHERAARRASPLRGTRRTVTGGASTGRRLADAPPTAATRSNSGTARSPLDQPADDTFRRRSGRGPAGGRRGALSSTRPCNALYRSGIDRIVEERPTAHEG